MALVQDDKFNIDLDKYWKVERDIIKVVLDYMNAVLNEEYVIEALNVIKTSNVISYSYTDCYKEAFKVLEGKLPEQYNKDKFILGLTLLHLIKAEVYVYKYTHTPTSNTTSWDEYYYRLCEAVASNTKCFSRAVGTVLVRDKTIIGTGYNGPPRGIMACDQRWEVDKMLQETYKKIYAEDFVFEKVKGKCPRQVLGFKSGEGLDWCVAGHGERNALIQAAREGICTKHTTLYMNCAVPCAPCLVEIINAGVEEIVITERKFYDKSGEYLLNNSSLKVRTYNFL